MTDKEKAARKKRYEEYKLAYAALMLCYPFTLEDLDGEIWRDIPGYEGRYQISNYGRVKSFKGGKVKILKPYVTPNGYLMVALNKGVKKIKKTIHRLVAEAFIPNPENKATVDHIFNNKFDNYYKNLRWATTAENVQFAYDTGASKSGSDTPQAKLTDEQVRYIRKVYKKGDPEFGMTALAKKFNVTVGVIYSVVNYKTYKNVK